MTRSLRRRVLTLSRLELAAGRQRENDVGITLTRPAHGSEPVDDRAREPDLALAVVIDSRLEVDAAKGHGRGDRVEGGLGDSDADHRPQLVRESPSDKASRPQAHSSKIGTAR